MDIQNRTQREIKFRAWDSTSRRWTTDIVRHTDMGNRTLQLKPPVRDPSFQVEIMQYTGLKDRHGVEIYEGDIVKGEYRTYVIEYYGAAFRLKTADDSSPDLLPVLENSSRIEVIGNIWENPELVEANQ